MSALLLIAAATLLLLLLSLRLGHHAVHPRGQRCHRRTNTQHQTHFTLARYYVAHRRVAYRLSAKDVITFDFQAAAPDVLLEIPAGSGWYSVQHAHRTDEMCWSLSPLAGAWSVGSAVIHHPGGSWPQRPGAWSAVGKEPPYTAPARGLLEMRGLGVQRQLHHTICSTEQDAERYFSLCTTPLVLRLLYALAGRFMPCRPLHALPHPGRPSPAGAVDPTADDLLAERLLGIPWPLPGLPLVLLDVATAVGRGF